MATPSKLPEPVDPVFTLREALAVIHREPRRIAINLADGEPPMPAPWRPRMYLRGATLYVHPLNEARGMRWLASQP